MLRVTKNMAKITSIKAGEQEIDSFVLIPGITYYQGIYTLRNTLWFQSVDFVKTIRIDFANEGELERFFMALMREIKINQITNFSSDKK